MLMDVVVAVAGLVLLVLAGDALVKGAVNLSLRLGIPALIVGLTVVAFGTSAPEMVVSVQAVLQGAPALAVGNVVGSNIANILLVLGIPALISALAVGRHLGRDFAIMIAATALFIALAMTGSFGTWQSLVLLAALALMLGELYLRARAGRTEVEVDDADPGMPGWKIAAFLIAGIIGLPLGASLLVDSAVSIATALGVSEAVIGLTLVAVGTSLPELATTIMAALRREAGVAMGNVIGSNVFNLLAIIGVAGLVGPIPIPAEMLALDIWVMLGSSLLLGLFIALRKPIGRLAGVVLISLYAAYLLVLIG